MDFNNSSTTNSIVARMNRICQTGNNTYSLADKASDCNEALDRYWALALVADGKWEIDDSNQSDLPSATTTLTSGQRDYSLGTDMMVVEKVLIKDESGYWHELDPVDLSQSQTNIHASNILEQASGTGIPTKYDIRGSSIFLETPPNYTQAASLRVVFKRGPSYFVSGDTTKVPGIPGIHHPFIPRYGSLQFLIDKDNKRAANLATQVQVMEDSITEFYAKRHTGDKQQITVRKRRRM